MYIHGIYLIYDMNIHEIALSSFAWEWCSLKIVWLRHYNSHTHDMRLQHWNGSKFIVSQIVYTWYIPCIYHVYTLVCEYTWYIHGIYMVYAIIRIPDDGTTGLSVLKSQTKPPSERLKSLCYSTVRTNLSSQRLYNCLQRFTIPVGGRFALGLQNG